MERHNRTLKYDVGFISLGHANSYLIFSIWFCFLRSNSSLDWKTIAEVDELKGISNMLNTWMEVIHLGDQYIDIYS